VLGKSHTRIVGGAWRKGNKGSAGMYKWSPTISWVSISSLRVSQKEFGNPTKLAITVNF
jgi:hypothetical protein